MPYKTLIDNSLKSANRLWSDELILSTEAKLQEFVTKEPALGEEESTKKLVKLIEKQKEWAAAVKIVALHGKTAKEEGISSFESNKMALPPPAPMQHDNFNFWIDLFENYFLLAGHDVKLKERYLIHCIGPSCSKILNAIKPLTIDKIQYDQLVAKCREIFRPINQRQASLAFLSMCQTDENILQFSLKVREQAAKGGIKDEQLLINMFIKGITSGKIKYELMKESENKKTLDELVKYAQWIEECENSANKSFINEVATNSVNKVQERKDKNYDKKPQEKRPNNFKPKCFFCKKIGHFKKECKKYQSWKARQEEKGKNNDNINVLTESMGNLHF